MQCAWCILDQPPGEGVNAGSRHGRRLTPRKLDLLIAPMDLYSDLSSTKRFWSYAQMGVDDRLTTVACLETHKPL